MRLFTCQFCAQLLFFENVVCERCSHALGYLPGVNALSALEDDGNGQLRAFADAGGRRYRHCANATHGVCNWLVPAETPETLCLACRYNGTIPDPGNPAKVVAWQKIERAKHRLLYSIVRLNLPAQTRAAAQEEGLLFDFLADPPEANAPKVITGHDNGVITIALAEAEDAERERRRTSMGEPYRTLLGHFRHEIGHYYWDRLVRDCGMLDECRALFGEDREDYGEAIKAHYKRGGPPPNWQERYVSAYATMHAWEDFAETWSHYLHIVDTLEMAAALDLEARPDMDKYGALTFAVNFDPYWAETIEQLVGAWLPFAAAANNVNRCMGQPDLYPFILSPPVIEKLGFIHRLVLARRPAE